MSPSAYEKSSISAVRRYPDRASYDKKTVHAIVAEAKIASVAWVDEESGLPQCVPMIAALQVDPESDDVFLYFHG